MPGQESAIGFGFQYWGDFPFGEADWAEEVTWEVIPLYIRDDDAKADFDPPEPLRKVIDSIKPLVQEIQDLYEQFPDLWDANKCRIDQLQSLAYNFNITLNTLKDERLQRSEVLNAIQFFLNKGIDKGYQIAAAFSGLFATVTPIWADECAPGANLQEAGPTEFIPRFDLFGSDDIPADAVYSDFYEKWPKALAFKTICRSAWLKLYFYKPDDTEIPFDEFSATVEDVLKNVERVRPIHVRILEYRFDGPAAVGGGWVTSVVAQNNAVGGGWAVPVVANLSAVGGGWAVPVVASTTP